MLIGLEDEAPRYIRGDDLLGDGVYIADDGLENDCLDLEVIGYNQIATIAPPHFPTAPRRSIVVGIIVPNPSSSAPSSRPSMEIVTGDRPPATTALAPQQ